jgi:hypothetical protein
VVIETCVKYPGGRTRIRVTVILCPSPARTPRMYPIVAHPCMCCCCIPYYCSYVTARSGPSGPGGPQHVRWSERPKWPATYSIRYRAIPSQKIACVSLCPLAHTSTPCIYTCMYRCMCASARALVLYSTTSLPHIIRVDMYTGTGILYVCSDWSPL